MRSRLVRRRRAAPAPRASHRRRARDGRAALADADAVLVCLAMADITLPATDFADSVRTIVPVMTTQGPDRLLVIGNSGVLPAPGGGYRFGENLTPPKSNLAAEHIRNYETLRDSSLRWTLMCPVWLKEEISPGHARFAYDDLPEGPGETGNADLALTMVALIDAPESVGRRVGTSAGGTELRSRGS
jgi:hypothetical protein